MFLHHHGRGVEADQAAAAVSDGAGFLQHLLTGQHGVVHHPRRENLVSTAAVVRQVAAVTAAEGAQIALVGLLACVGAHVGLQVALIRRGKRAQVAAVGFLTFTHTHKERGKQSVFM